jgi:hypothetical protein
LGLVYTAGKAMAAELNQRPDKRPYLNMAIHPNAKFLFVLIHRVQFVASSRFGGAAWT